MQRLRKLFKTALANLIYIGYGGALLMSAITVFFYFDKGVDFAIKLLILIVAPLTLGIVSQLTFRYFFRGDDVDLMGQPVDLLPQATTPTTMLMPLDINLEKYVLFSQGGLRILPIYCCPLLILAGVFFFVINPSEPFGMGIILVNALIFFIAWIIPSGRIIVCDRTTGLVHIPRGIFRRKRAIRIVDCHARYLRHITYPAGFASFFFLYHEPSEVHYTLCTDGSGGSHEWTFLYRYMTRYYDDKTQQRMIDDYLEKLGGLSGFDRFISLGWRWLLPSKQRF